MGIPGAALDQAGKSLALNADYAFNDRVSFALDYRLRHGDVVTTMGDYDELYAVAKAATRDTALGSDLFAYRLNGTTAGLHAGIGITLNSKLLLSIDFERLATHAAGGNNYFKSLPTAKVSYAF